MRKLFNNLFKTFFGIILVISVFFFIMERNAYKAVSLMPVGITSEPFQEKEVHISAKRYTAYDSKAFLDRDVLQLGFSPVQITIQNNTNHSYALSTQSLKKPFAKGKQVANAVSYTAIPRSIGFKVACIFFWPFIFPSAVDTILTVTSHQKMRKDYYAKSLKDQEEWILPYSTTHRIIFFPATQEEVENFSLTLREKNSFSVRTFPVKISN